MENESKRMSKKDLRIAELEQALEKANAEKEELHGKVNSIEAQLAMLMKKVAGVPTVDDETEEDEVAVVSRNFVDTALESPDGSVLFVFKVGEQKYISADDMRNILKENATHRNKRLFERGLFYFTNPDDYKRFKITPRIDLSYERVKEIITQDSIENMIAEFDRITNNARDRGVAHVFAFEVVEMLKDSSAPLRNWNYENRVALEQRIGRKFDDLIAQSCYFDILKNR